MKRIATIQAPTDMGASGTNSISINLKDKISRITFIWKATVATVSVMLAPTLRSISKVELIDGSDVLESLSGEEWQARNFYDRKQMPYNSISLTVGGFLISEFSIDFGKFLWDPVLAFDPTKFVNPQLRITWDEDAANTSVVTNSLEIYAHIFDGEEINPIGFISNKQIHQAAMSASTHIYVDLPSDLAYKSIIVRPYTEARDVNSQLSNIKLGVNVDKQVIINMPSDDYIWQLLRDYPRIHERVIYDAAVTAKTLFGVPSMDNHATINYDATAFVTAQSKFALATYTAQKIALAASVDIKAMTGLVGGHIPHCCINIPFGDQNDETSWLKLNPEDDLLLDVTQSASASSSDTHYVDIQQLRLY